MNEASYEREQAYGKLLMSKSRLVRIYKKAGRLQGEVRRDMDDVIGTDFMKTDLKTVQDNVEELRRLKKEAKTLIEKIKSIQSRYNFDEDLEFE